MPERTDDELKQLARDIYASHVFTDRHLRLPEDISMVFMPLALMDEKNVERLRQIEPQMFYEYLDKAGERSINGYPFFMSMNIISKADWPRLSAYLKALYDAPDPLASVTVEETEEGHA